MGERITLVTAVFLTACTSGDKAHDLQDSGLGLSNSPTAQIIAPIAAETIRDGTLFIARGLVSDADQNPETLTVHWFVGDEGLPRPCPQGTLPDPDGLTQCDVAFSFDKPSIRLLVTDANGNTAEDTVTINLVAAEAPEVAITAPTGEQLYRTTDLISFEGTATDNEDASGALGVWWDSDIQGLLDLSQTINDAGAVSGTGFLEPGAHVVRLWAEDTSGRQSSASVLVQVFPPAAPPVVAMVSPLDGTTLNVGDLVLFQANVVDEFDRPEDIDISWSSTIDGELASTIATSDGDTQFSTSGLSQGEHAVTVVATDSDGLTAMDTVLLSVMDAGAADGEPDSVD